MIAPLQPFPDDARQPPVLGGSAGEQVAAAIARSTVSGLPLAQALAAYSDEIPSGRTRRTLRHLSESLQRGTPLEQAVTQLRPPMPAYLGGLLQAAAETGQLGLVLEQHLLARRRNRDTRRRFWISAAYPLVLLSASVAILIAMLVYFVPTVADLLTNFGVPIPAATQVTIEVSAAVIALLPYWRYGLTLLGIVCAAVFCLQFLPGRPARTRLWQRLPLFGTAARSVALSEFCGCLALLVECRVPLPQALRLTSGVLRDSNLAEGSRRLAEQCEQGLPPDQESAYLPNFPPSLTPVFRWNSRPDALAGGLRAAAELYAAQARVRTWVAGSLIQPIVLGVVVTLIGGVVVTLFLPLFALLQSLTGPVTGLFLPSVPEIAANTGASVEILVTTLLVPLIGAVLLIAEWQSRTAFGRSTRANWRRGLQACGLLLAPIVAGMAWHAVARLASETLIEQIVPTVARLLMIVAASRAAYRAWQVGALGDYYSADVAAMLLQSRPRSELRLSAWILACFPLLWAALPCLLLVAPLLFAVAILRMNDRVERTRFLGALAVAVEHNMDLAAEVNGFAAGARWRRREQFVALAGRLRDGTRLSDALAADAQLVSPNVVAAVRIAEQSGSLGAALRAEANRQQQALCGQFSDSSVFALICYYWVVLVVLAGIASALSYWIAPKFQEIFKDFGYPLPPLTERVLEMSAGSPLFVMLVIPLLLVPATTLLLLSTRSVDDGGSGIWTPLSRIFPRRDAPGVLRWLALAVDSRRPLPALITDVAERLPRSGVAVRLLRSAQSMTAGSEPWEALARESFLSRREVAAVRAADRAGGAPLALNAIADAIERAQLRRVLWWIEWLRPLVMLIFGGLVGVYCVGYFLPIVEMIRRSALE